MKPINKIIIVALGCFSLIMLGSTGFVRENSVEQAGIIGTAEKKGTIEIRSPVVSALPPHVHLPTDDISKHASVVYSEYVATEDFYILGYTGKMDNASLDILHHAHLYLKNQPDVCLPHSYIAGKSRMAFSERIAYPTGYGIFIPKGTVLLLETMLHHPLGEGFSLLSSGKTYFDVSFVMNFETAYAKDVAPGSIKKLEVFMRSLSDKKCPRFFVVPPHSKGYTLASDDPTEMITFPQDGALVMAIAHYHPWAGGKSLKIFINTKELFEFLPEVLAVPDGKKWIIPHLRGEPMLRRVKKGDFLTFSAIYDNPASLPSLEEETMAVIFVFFSPDN